MAGRIDCDESGGDGEHTGILVAHKPRRELRRRNVFGSEHRGVDGGAPAVAYPFP